mmetsp:Transcript_5115/g.15618  ORF Transcript_5115/g.15618 Transcript_5115/m.15618 type:complete len:261 (-) Transcript_5115:648-1430(-)
MSCILDQRRLNPARFGKNRLSQDVDTRSSIVVRRSSYRRLQSAIRASDRALHRVGDAPHAARVLVVVRLLNSAAHALDGARGEQIGRCGQHCSAQRAPRGGAATQQVGREQPCGAAVAVALCGQQRSGSQAAETKRSLQIQQPVWPAAVCPHRASIATACCGAHVPRVGGASEAAGPGEAVVAHVDLRRHGVRHAFDEPLRAAVVRVALELEIDLAVHHHPVVLAVRPFRGPLAAWLPIAVRQPHARLGVARVQWCPAGV